MSGKTSISFFYKSMLISGMLLLFCGTLSHAQNVVLKRSHSIQAINSEFSSIEAPDSLSIIAIRVSFQPDDNRLTSGDGTFEDGSLPYLSNNEITIDPLPHNQAYFEAHLEFAKNYFTKVSGDDIDIEYRVLPDIYQLDNQMEFYSPTGETFSNEKLALLARDTWEKVEENGGFDTSGLDPDNTAFVIFHAGVGRDIQLTGTTLDITPQDIPSLTLNRESLSALLDDPDFSGFPINNGTFRVTNSLILPRTLSRRGEDITGQEFVLQLSINGLLCASIGSYFGLPDLFNTQTGNSGIGRFGLMDGESFFSYRGLFPPEPSAWEKMQLGWQNAFTINAQQSGDILLPAASLNQQNSIAKYNLSSDEYFLVENRHRDPQNNGATLTIQQSDGTLTEQNFPNSNLTFVDQEQGFEELFAPGVLVNIDNFDWSLPGGLDAGADEEAGTDDDRFLNGGILIWHIDEAVIRREIDRQAVNANPERRGIDLEEADGAQDIGEAASDNFSNQGRGWAFDFWWRGNNASVVTLQNDTLRLYENRFSDDTTPSNHSNSEAQSYFEFYDFSENLPIASFRIRPISTEMVKPRPISEVPVPGESAFISEDDLYRTDYPLGLSVYTAQSDSFLIIPVSNAVYALQVNDDNATYFDFGQTNPQQPYLGNQLILTEAPAGESAINLNARTWSGTAWQNSWQATAGTNKGFLSSFNDDTLLVDFTEERLLITNGASLPDLPIARQSSITLSGRSSLLEPGQLSVTGTTFTESIANSERRQYTGGLQLEPGKTAFYLLTDNTFSIIDTESTEPFKTIAKASFLEWPALADFNNDQRIDILYTDESGKQLFGKNYTGASLDYFPISAPRGSRFIGTPLIADLDGDNSQDVLITVQDSISMNIYAFDQKGELKENFPLFIGSVQNTDFQPIHPVINNKSLYAISHSGELKAWTFPGISDVLWTSRYGNESYNKVTGRISNSEQPELPPDILVEDETYNWPNPASESTHIRYQLREAGNVGIKIISQGGRIIYDESFEATGGVPEEQQIITSGWGNGIYFALVTATVNGQTARKMIKIAVAH